MKKLFMCVVCSLFMNTVFAQSPDQLDLSRVTFLHRSIKDWAVTSTITSVSFTPLGSPEGSICIPHTKAGQWPSTAFGEITVEGNPWVFAEINGQWYGATYDWIRTGGQACKGERLEALGPDQIRIPPMDGGWVPRPGQWLCFAQSTRARDGVFAGMERSNVACAPVPGAVPGPPPPSVGIPVPVPPTVPPTVPPVVTPPVEGVLLAHIQDVQHKLEVLQGTTNETLTQIVEHRKEVRSKWESVMGWIGRNAAIPVGSAIAAWLLKGSE